MEIPIRQGKKATPNRFGEPGKPYGIRLPQKTVDVIEEKGYDIALFVYQAVHTGATGNDQPRLDVYRKLLKLMHQKDVEVGDTFTEDEWTILVGEWQIVSATV